MATTVADLLVRVTGDVSDAIKSLGEVDKKVEQTAKKVKAVGVGMAAVGAVGAAGLFAAVKSAASFEQAIANVNAVADLSAQQLASVRDLALQIGADTAFSATEAANAIEELVKAGVSVEDVLSGAARGAANLAAAAGVSIPNAATIMSNALNLFNLEGSEATRVADVFAAAANKSAADVNDLALGMQQSGTVAAQFGLSLEDTVGALALFSDYGLRGSDAGTSLKTALLSLLDPTAKQRELMNELGLSFFDAQGNFIGLEGAAGVLRERLSGLTQEQRQTALAVLFGSDAVRAASILYDAGAEGVAEYVKAVSDQGAAQEMAAKRMDTLNGALEELSGSVETAMIAVGSELTPIIRRVAEAAADAVDVFLALPRPVRVVTAVALVLVAALLPLGAAITAVGLALPALSVALPAIAAGFGAIVAPVGLVVAALAALGIAYKKNLFGFADAVKSVVRFLRRFWDAVMRVQSGSSAAAKVLARLPRPVQLVARALGTVIRWARLTREAFGLLGDGSTRMRKILHQLPTPLQKIVIMASRVVSMVRRFFGVWSREGALAAFRTLTRDLEKLGRTFANFLATITGCVRFATGLKDIFREIGQLVRGIINLVDDFVHGRWGEVWRDFVNIVRDVFDLLGATLGALAGLILDIFDAIPWGTIGAALWRGFRAAVEFVFTELPGHLVSGLQAIFRAIPWGSIVGAMGSLGGWLLDKGRELLSGLYNGAVEFLTDTLIPWLGGLLPQVPGWVGDAAGWLYEKGKAVLRSLRDGARDYWEQYVKPWFAKLWDRVKSAVPDALTALKDHGWNLIYGIYLGVIEFWNEYIAPWFRAIWDKVKEFVPDALKALWQHGKDLIQGIKDGIDEAWSTISDWAAGIWDAVKREIPDALTALYDHGFNLLYGVWIGISEFWSTYLEPWARTLWDTIKALIPDALKALWQHGKDLLQGLMDGIGEAWSTVSEWASGIWDALKASIPDPLTALFRTGWNLIYGIYLGVLDFWNTWITPWFSAIWNTIKGLIPNPIDALYEIGRQFLGGLWNGILAVWRDLHDWFGGLANAIAEALPDDWGPVQKAFDGLLDILNAVTKPFEVVFNKIQEIWDKLFGKGGGDSKPATDALRLPEAFPQTQGFPALFDAQPTIDEVNRAEAAISEFINKFPGWVTNFRILGEALGNALKNGFKAAIGPGGREPLPTVAEEIVVSTLDAIDLWMGDFTKSGENLGTSLRRGFMTQADDLYTIEIPATLLPRVAQALNSGRGQMQSAGTNLGRSVMTGFAQGVRENTSLATAAVNAVLLVVKSINGYIHGWSVGYSIGQGLNAGIAAWTSTIAATAAAAVRNAIAAARSEAAAASPSRKMLDLGRDLMTGLALGIERTAGEVSRAMAASVAPALAPVAVTTTPGSTVGAVAARGMGGLTINGGVQITIQDAGDPEATADAVWRAFAREVRLRRWEGV